MFYEAVCRRPVMKLFSMLVITLLSFNVFGYEADGQVWEICSPSELALIAEQMNGTKEAFANHNTPALIYSSWKQTAEQFHRCRIEAQQNLIAAVINLNIPEIDHMTEVLKDVHKFEPIMRNMISQKGTLFVHKGKEVDNSDSSPHLVFGYRLRCLAKTSWTPRGTRHCSNVEAN